MPKINKPSDRLEEILERKALEILDHLMFECIEEPVILNMQSFLNFTKSSIRQAVESALKSVPRIRHSRRLKNLQWATKEPYNKRERVAYKRGWNAHLGMQWSQLKKHKEVLEKK